MPANTREQFSAVFGIPLREGHGMTEVGAAIINPEKLIRPGSLGKPLEDVDARLVGADGKDVRDGMIGELLLRSPSMFVGYWDDPAATADVVMDGWMRTGDLCRRDPDGYYWFEGRKKEINVRGGSRISLQEVEEAVYAHPAGLPKDPIGKTPRLAIKGGYRAAHAGKTDSIQTQFTAGTKTRPQDRERTTALHDV
jgi:long-chain acyl-CoA synthetase